MRVIVEVFGRAWALQFNSGKIVEQDELEDDEFPDRAPVDPHSVGGCHIERRSSYEDAVGQTRFGFHGSQG